MDLNNISFELFEKYKYKISQTEFCCKYCGKFTSRNNSLSYHEKSCKYKYKNLNYFEKTLLHLSRLKYNKLEYNIKITYLMIKGYEIENKVHLSKKEIKSIFYSHKNCILNNKKLTSIKSIIASIKNCYIACKSEKAIIASKINGPKNLKKGRENHPEKFKELGKNNLNNWKENHPDEYKNAQIKGGINSYNNQLKDKIAEHPEWREKGQKKGVKSMKQYWDEHPLEKTKRMEKMMDGGKKWRADHQEELIEKGKILNKYVSSIPDFHNNSCKKAREAYQKKIDDGTINPFCSKEEISCREELESKLNVKFDRYIKIKNSNDNNFGKFHPYDFGLKKVNLLIEYDGIYWHSLEDSIKRDKYWTKIAKDLGYTLIRINSEDWKNKIKKEDIIQEISQALKKSINHNF